MVDMFEWKHPNYYKKIKKESRLKNQSNDDKENHDEKIQSKNIRTRNRRNSNNTTRQRTNDRADRE